jgi:hypothetical protein
VSAPVPRQVAAALAADLDRAADVRRVQGTVAEVRPDLPGGPGGVEGVARAAAFDEEHPPVLLRRREWLLHLGLEGSPFAGGDADRPF